MKGNKLAVLVLGTAMVTLIGRAWAAPTAGVSRTAKGPVSKTKKARHHEDHTAKKVTTAGTNGSTTPTK